MKKALRLLLAVLALAVAGLQFNDPDPWAWVAIYLAAAIMLVCHPRGKDTPHSP